MKRSALFISLFAACTSIEKAPPQDDPIVDDTAADSLRSPTMRGAIATNGLAADDLSSTALYHGFTLSLRAGQSIDVRLGGVGGDGSILDTVLYLYGPKNSAGSRGAYLRR